jgi:hypothetical protein
MKNYRVVLLFVCAAVVSTTSGCQWLFNQNDNTKFWIQTQGRVLPNGGWRVAQV